ncbi:hypothetical protein [Microtetraspora sp. NBRC 13810]|uniref:hypothetical protein n=1 Tax=Microtetraspora sp. NBRC 13810 TaxID=3030990 RepID=UPI002552DE0B|nr:hypothetical protein [Microtetraspora sp. NBRC 13810]
MTVSSTVTDGLPVASAIAGSPVESHAESLVESHAESHVESHAGSHGEFTATAAAGHSFASPSHCGNGVPHRAQPAREVRMLTPQ